VNPSNIRNATLSSKNNKKRRISVGGCALGNDLAKLTPGNTAKADAELQKAHPQTDPTGEESLAAVRPKILKKEDLGRSADRRRDYRKAREGGKKGRNVARRCEDVGGENWAPAYCGQVPEKWGRHHDAKRRHVEAST